MTKMKSFSDVNREKAAEDDESDAGWETIDLDGTQEAEVLIEDDEAEALPASKRQPKQIDDEDTEVVLIDSQEDTLDAVAEDADEEPKQKELPRSQKRIIQLNAEKKAALEEAEAARQELLEFKRQAAERQKAEHVSRLASAKGNLDRYRKDLKAAKTSMDTDAEVEALERLQQAQVEVMALENYKEPEAEPVKARARAQKSRDEMIESLPTEAKRFAKKHSWFLTNNVLTQAALGVSAEIEAEGYSVDEPEYFLEVEKRMAEMYPGRFAKKNKAAAEDNEEETVDEPNKARVKPRSPVAATARTAPTAKKQVVRLSPEDIRLAKYYGMTPQEYAREKKKSDEAGDGYMDVF